MADRMLDSIIENANGTRITCTVDRHCRTRIFDFPLSQPTGPVPHYAIYRSDSVHASLVCDLRAYFGQSESPHYGLSSPFRHQVAELIREKDSQGERINPYMVIEEMHNLPPVVLERGCAEVDEVCHVNGQSTPLLTGGRENARFIFAIETSDGPWPDIPCDEQTVNMILAATRASQDAHDEIRKHIDQGCLVTDDGQFVYTRPAGYMSARAGVVNPLDADGFRKTAESLGTAISRMEADLAAEHMELLVNSLYWDDYRDDEFRRLHYLSLWQSLYESRKNLGYTPPKPKTEFRTDPTVVGGTSSLAELTRYRNDIAHIWTGNIESKYLADIYRTINELLRRKYF